MCRMVDLKASAVLVGRMNIATTRGWAKSSLSLPNILTFARIAAIPLVVGCIYWQAILDGPLWLRWVALWAAIVILCREILVSGLREYLAGLRVSVPVTKLAKWKTTAQLVAIGFLLAGEAGDQVIPHTTEIGLLLLWLSAIVTIYTGWDYFRAGIRHLIEEDEG
jgi:cardiolipin synthase (CMP-forming)